jgi:hypothetical protein
MDSRSKRGVGELINQLFKDHDWYSTLQQTQ